VLPSLSELNDRSGGAATELAIEYAKCLPALLDAPPHFSKDPLDLLCRWEGGKPDVVGLLHAVTRMGKAMNDFAVIGHQDETLGILIEAAGPGIADEALSPKDSTERVPTVGVVVAAQLADRLVVTIDPRLSRKKWQWLATKV